MADVVAAGMVVICQAIADVVVASAAVTAWSSLMGCFGGDPVEPQPQPSSGAAKQLGCFGGDPPPVAAAAVEGRGCSCSRSQGSGL